MVTALPADISTTPLQTPEVVPTEALHLIQDATESSVGVCRARPGLEAPDPVSGVSDIQFGDIDARVADIVLPSPSCIKTSETPVQLQASNLPTSRLNGHTSAGQTKWVRGSAARWTAAQQLEFVVLWLAVELPLSEIACHFGLAERHLRRLRSDYRLEDRATILRLNRAGRRRHVTHEALAGFMSPEAQALLKTAQARRRVQDEIRDGVKLKNTLRSWRYRRRASESAEDHAERLRVFFKKLLRPH